MSLGDRLKNFLGYRKIDRTSFAVIFVSVVGYLVWFNAFPLFGPILVNFLEGLKFLYIERGRVMLLFLGAMLISSLAVGYLSDRIKRRVWFIWGSTLLASLSTFAFIWLNKLSEIVLLSPLLGFIAGLSPAAWGAYFADCTSPEDRGRVMGISVGLSIPLAYLFLIATPFNIGGTAKNELILIGAGLLVTLLTLTLRPQEKIRVASSRRGRGPAKKQILYYAIPLFLFYLVAGILLSTFFPFVQDHVRNEVFYVVWALPFLVGAILAGNLLDSMGRKFPSIVGLAVTGVSLALFAIFLSAFRGGGIQYGWIWVIPLAVGYSFVSISSFIIWADLAPARSRGLFYGGGIALMASALILGLFLTGTVFGTVSARTINNYTLFSSIALFIGIIPLILAEEAIPKELIERRQMLEYLDQVKNKFT